MTPRHLSAAQNGSSSSNASDAPSPECQEAVTKLWDYLDGNCSSELATRIGGHLASCEPCLRILTFQERFFDSLARFRERRPAPARLHVRVRKALAVERQS